jgi:penicillin-binding protein-related factor A (putative recombinase)
VILFPTPPPAAGQPHANRGKAFEQQLQLQLERYRRAGWLVIRQYPAVLLQEGGKSARVIGKAPPDWLLCKNGRLFVIDAKSHQGERWPLSEVAPHQARWFDETQAAGGQAGVVLNREGAVWWLPWCELGQWWHRHHRGEAGRGQASLGAAELAEVGDRCPGCDFLAVAG